MRASHWKQAALCDVFWHVKALMACGKSPLLFVYSPAIITIVYHHPVCAHHAIMRAGERARGFGREKQSEGEKHLREEEKWKERLLCWERCLELRARPPLEVKGPHCVCWVPLLQLIWSRARGHITLGGSDERSQVGLGMIQASYCRKLFAE